LKRRTDFEPGLQVQFENPQIPEGINVGASRPLKDFAAIAVSLIVFAVLAALVLYVAAGAIAKRVSFETEARIAGRFIKPNAERGATELALQGLADRLIGHMNVPAGMRVHVHYQDNATINAMATLGGNVFMYRGLLEKLPHENALAMVMAHEIAHVLHRDPVVGAGRGVAMAVALSSLTMGVGEGAAGRMISSSALLTGLTFSREQELAADEAALAAVARQYGHVGGATELFRIFQQLREGRGEPPKFLATHPLTADRITRIEALARERGWLADGAVTPLDPALRPLAKPAPAPPDQ
jgi:Zn-dependent protease with chaperone function